MSTARDHLTAALATIGTLAADALALFDRLTTEANP
jgi:hypothetical protein